MRVIIVIAAWIIGAGLVACVNDGLMTSPQGSELGVPSHASQGLLNNRRSIEVAENFPFKKVLAFGDSLTIGVTQRSGSGLSGSHSVLTTVEGYVPKLWRLMEEKYGTGIRFVIEGVGAENSREALDRIDTFIHRHDPDLVLILSGIVDVNVALPLVPRFPIVRSSVAEMMRIVLLRGKVPVIGTYPSPNPDGFRVGAVEHIERLNHVIRQEAKAKDVLIADHEADSYSDYRGQGADGLHPNNIGYERMAQSWFNKIEEALERKGFTQE